MKVKGLGKLNLYKKAINLVTSMWLEDLKGVVEELTEQITEEATEVAEAIIKEKKLEKPPSTGTNLMTGEDMTTKDKTKKLKMSERQKMDLDSQLSLREVKRRPKSTLSVTMKPLDQDKPEELTEETTEAIEVVTVELTEEDTVVEEEISKDQRLKNNKNEIK